MGKVNEYESMEKIDVNESFKLLSTDINKTVELSVSVVPISFNVFLNDDLIYSCSILKNAEILYRVIQADLAGKAYCGEV